MFYHVNILARMQDVCVPVYTCLAIGINLLDLESYNLCMYNVHVYLQVLCISVAIVVLLLCRGHVADVYDMHWSRKRQKYNPSYYATNKVYLSITPKAYMCFNLMCIGCCLTLYSITIGLACNG